MAWTKVKARRANRRHYARNKEKVKEWNKARRLVTWKFYQEIKDAASCVNCGETTNVCLDFHHLDPATKFMEVATMVGVGYQISRVAAEIEKCIVLCSNCHRKVHHGLLEIEKGENEVKLKEVSLTTKANTYAKEFFEEVATKPEGKFYAFEEDLPETTIRSRAQQAGAALGVKFTVSTVTGAEGVKPSFAVGVTTKVRKPRAKKAAATVTESSHTPEAPTTDPIREHDAIDLDVYVPEDAV